MLQISEKNQKKNREKHFQPKEEVSGIYCCQKAKGDKRAKLLLGVVAGRWRHGQLGGGGGLRGAGEAGERSPESRSAGEGEGSGSTWAEDRGSAEGHCSILLPSVRSCDLQCGTESAFVGSFLPTS